MSWYDVRDHGAVGDGTTLDTAAVQAAVDAAHAAGGGTVLVPAGATFLVGSVELRSAVELHVERGAVLQGSPRWADYTARFDAGALSAGVVTEQTQTSAALITARDATDVAITGGGVIDGAGAAFVEREDGDILRLPNERPFLAFLLGSDRVTVRDVVLRDSALWTLRLTGCEDVSVHDVRIRADLRLPNSDGIDIDRCRRVRISDCDIECGDDAISLKTCDEWPEHGPCEDVTVTGCTIATRSSALVVGVDVSAPIRDVVFSSCVVRECQRGLSVSAGTGGDIENVLFSDIVVRTRLHSPAWWGAGEPIFVRSAPWHDDVGTIRHVRFRNILAHGEAGAVVVGAAPGLVDDVVLDGVRLELSRSTDWDQRRDLRPWDHANGDAGQGLEPGLETGVVVPGFAVEQADRVVLRDCEVVWRGPDLDGFGSVVRSRATTGLVLDGVRGRAARPSVPDLDLDQDLDR